MHTTRFVLYVAPVTLLLTACDSTAPRPMQRINLSPRSVRVPPSLLVRGRHRHGHRRHCTHHVGEGRPVAYRAGERRGVRQRRQR